MLNCGVLDVQLFENPVTDSMKITPLRKEDIIHLSLTTFSKILVDLHDPLEIHSLPVTQM